MNGQNDILERAQQGGNPFRTPEGYFDSLEDRLTARISVEEAAPETGRRRLWTVLKPALALAATFALVFGMGYGVLSFTHTLDRGTDTAAPDYAAAEEEMIRPASLINYYQTDSQAEDDELDEETLLNYLSSQLNYSALAEIYAQSYSK